MYKKEILPKGDNQWSELIPIENYIKVKGEHIMCMEKNFRTLYFENQKR